MSVHHRAALFAWKARRRLITLPVLGGSPGLEAAFDEDFGHIGKPYLDILLATFFLQWATFLGRLPSGSVEAVMAGNGPFMSRDMSSSSQDGQN